MVISRRLLFWGRVLTFGGFGLVVVAFLSVKAIGETTLAVSAFDVGMAVGTIGVIVVIICAIKAYFDPTF